MNLTTLSNGLRIVTEQIDHTRSAAINIFIGSGSRHETQDNSGVSHFIEHVLFKGTSKRTAVQLSEEMDIMGGQLNAYTTKEYTCLYAHALENHVTAALEIMCDMLKNPLMQDSDINVERGVILEEIGMYEDSPEEYCADLLSEAVYKDSSLGGNILGTKSTVAKLKSDDLISHMRKYYVPERMTVSICGRFDEEAAIDVLKSYFGDMKDTGNKMLPCNVAFNGGITLKKRKFEQSHIILAFEGLPIGDKRRYAASVFSAIAGGSSSSRLNRRIREELGLAYSVYSFSSSYLGTGMFGIGAGINHDNQKQVLSEILEILGSLRVGISEEELYRTKEQFKAVMVMGLESSSSLASSMGRSLLLENKYTDVDTMIKFVDNLTSKDIREAAELIINPKSIALTVVGKPEMEDIYRNILETYCQ